MKQPTGFTLVETLVAITVLLVGVIGPLSIAARGIGDGLFAGNQLAANYLAQEGIELVINKRYELTHRAQSAYPPPPPNTIFSGDFITPPDHQISNCIDRTCVLSATNIANSFIVDDTCGTVSDDHGCDLVFNKTRGFYQKPGLDLGDTGPIFSRTVYLSHPGGNLDILQVRVVIGWQNKGVPKSLAIIEEVFSQG